MEKIETPEELAHALCHDRVAYDEAAKIIASRDTALLREAAERGKGKYEVITLCGSTRFKDQFIEQQKRLTLEGKIVISVGCFGHSGDVFTDEQKTMLDDMHKRKIDMADGIFVINVGGYIGSSTKGEIEYAVKMGKKVTYLEPLPPPPAGKEGV